MKAPAMFKTAASSPARPGVRTWVETTVAIALALSCQPFDFSNGWHDSANAIATVVSTHVLTPGRAGLLAAVLNIAGAFMSNAVGKMIGGGVVGTRAGQ